MEREFKIGDWVKGNEPGFHQIIGITHMLLPEDVPPVYKKGVRGNKIYICKRLINRMRKLAIIVFGCDGRFIQHVSDTEAILINEYLDNHPKEKNIFEEYLKNEDLGDVYVCIKAWEHHLDWFYSEVNKLSSGLNLNEINNVYSDIAWDYIDNYYRKEKKGKKIDVYIYTKVIEDTVFEGNVPLYEKPICVIAKPK